MYLLNNVLHGIIIYLFLQLDKRRNLYYTLPINLRGKVKFLTGGKARDWCLCSRTNAIDLVHSRADGAAEAAYPRNTF
ncbi:MAG TPA: hypothetical protein PKL03_08225 [Candidatus Omnitrophota bacterium]|nr:hypothetical protein [Candidatus Omnitrophota bacterium]